MLISKQDFKKQQIVLAAAIFVGLTIYLIGFIILLSALLILQNSKKKKNDFHNNSHEQHRCFCLGIGGGWVLEYLHGSIYITMGV